MKICFVTRGLLRAFRETHHTCEKEPKIEEKTDLFLFGFEGLGEVCYEKELKGETAYFEDAARLSRENKSVVVCGCITDTRGHKRKSALIADDGKIIGISDMVNVVDGGVASGAALRVYETSLGRMGVIVAEDLNFPDVIRSLSVCGSDFIVCPFGGVRNSLQTTLLRANAYCYGVPILFCSIGYCMIADVSGDIVFASPLPSVRADFKNVKEYHLIETRRRGFFCLD